MKFIIFCLLCCVSSLLLAKNPVQASKAMVVSEQYLASGVGKQILLSGGNAIDAAVAVGYALAVVNPPSGNIGGGGFMTIHLANGQNVFLNFRERAPLQAKSTLFLDKQGGVDTSKSTQGYLAVAVPGTVLGFETALHKYGKLTRQQVMTPAIRLAEQGYRLSPGDIKIYRDNIAYFKQDANVAKIFLKQGKPYQVGDLFVQRDLAHTLKLIATHGANAFYQGWIAKQIVAASTQHKGILTLADFHDYYVEELAPIACHYHQYHIFSAPPPSSGGVTLCEILQILEAYPLSRYGYHSVNSMRYMIEAMRYSFADRNAYLGDPKFVNNPINQILSPRHIKSIRAQIDARNHPPNTFKLPAQNTLHEGNQTTHYSIIDKWGNAVAVTYTLNSYYGAKVIAGKTGFFLNNEMDDFSAKPGMPNQFGLMHSDKNSIAGGKRPLSSMTPTIVMQNGKVLMVVGSPGGPRIITATLQALLNVLDFGMNIQDAVDAKRFHHQALPDLVYSEPQALSFQIKTALEREGYVFSEEKPWGAVEAIYIDPKTQRILGGSDDRRQAGKAVGY